MSTYSFKFKFVENITGVGGKINSMFGKMRNSANSFRLGVNKMPKSIQDIEDELISLKAQRKTAFSTKEVKKYGRQINVLETKLNRLNIKGKSTNRIFGSLPGKLGGIGSLIGGAFAIGGISAFGNELLSTMGEFERYEAVLKNTFGGDSSIAKTVLGDISNFASKTPFQVNELTDSFVKLANRGFIPNQNEMKKMGDLASSQGKSFDQLAEAILDAETGEFERMKELGIVARSQGDKVKLAFKGVVKEIDKSPEAIRKAVLEFGAMDGVAGSMEEISKTTGGMLSNLKDAGTQTMKTLGEAIQPVVQEWLPKISLGFQHATTWIGANRETIGGWLRTGVKVIGVVLGIFAAFKTFALVQSIISIVGVGLSFLFSPIGLVVAGIALVGFWIYKMIKHWDVFKKYMFGVAKFLWKTNPFGFMIDLLMKVFPSFKKGLYSLFEGIKKKLSGVRKWFYDHLIKPIADWLKPLKKWFHLDFNWKAHVETKVDNKSSKDGNQFYQGLKSKFGMKGLSFSSGKSKELGGSVSNAIDNSIAGKAGKIINVSINKLVEQLTVQTQTLQDAPERIKELITEALLSAVNDVNYN